MKSAAAEAEIGRARSELERILALPSRPVLDCERDERRRWAPEAQALVEHVTALYALPERRTCACRERRVEALGGGRLVVYGDPSPGEPPPLPEEMTVAEFRRECVNFPDHARLASDARPGQTVRLEGISRVSPCITQFNPFQAWSLRELPIVRGLFGMGSVGIGKTILLIMAPLTIPELKTWVVLAKSRQRVHYRQHYLRLREHFRVPALVYDKDGGRDSFIPPAPGTPVLHFIPYSVLSNLKNSRLFEQLAPHAVLADEAHCLANERSSRGGRFLRHMVEKNGRVFAGVTGTPIDTSIRNCAPLLTHALGTGSPMPIRPRVIDEWAQVFDPIMFRDTESDLAREIYQAFGTSDSGDKDLIAAGVLADDTAIRVGLRERVIQTPGVVSTRSSSVSCGLSFKERKIKLPDELSEPLKYARLGIRPDKEEIAEDDKIATCVRSVGAGYHYYWAYPKALPEHRLKGGLIDQWFEARKAFNKELRVKLARNEPNMDSRKLCENAAERAWRAPRYEGDLPVWPAYSWPRWAEICDQVRPEPRVRWLDDFLVRDAAQWATENLGIVWSRSRAFGMRVAELAGIPYCGGGPDSEQVLEAQDGSRSIVCSIRAHGESTDGLQHKFFRQLWAETLPSGKGVQQLLGRLVRPGQPAEEVETEVYRHTVEYRNDFDRALELAEFLQAQTPERQLILSASRDF